MSAPPAGLLANRGDPDARAVLDDWRLTHGIKREQLGMASASDGRRRRRRPLDSLASDGIGNDHRLSEPQKLGEPIHRLIVKRVLEADPRAWPQIEPPTKRSGR